MNDFRELDPGKMYQAIYDFPDQLADSMAIGEAIKLKHNYDNVQSVIVVGMGGSAIGGDVANMLAGDELKLPLQVVRNYRLPAWAGANTLVICSSYSGNTEETLAVYRQARAQGAALIGITTGGKIEQLLDADGYDKIKIVPGLQPRAALAYSFVSLLYLLQHLGMIGESIAGELQATIELLQARRDIYGATHNNPTLELAKRIAGKLPVIYGETDSTAVVAARWRGQLNENAKMLAHTNELPEMNHNEIVGWENNPHLLDQAYVIWLKDESDNVRVAHRREISNRLIDQYCRQETVAVAGTSRFVRLLHLIHFGDWLSFWCALEHGTDPTPVEKIMELKGQLEQIA